MSLLSKHTHKKMMLGKEIGPLRLAGEIFQISQASRLCQGPTHKRHDRTSELKPEPKDWLRPCRGAVIMATEKCCEPSQNLLRKERLEQIGIVLIKLLVLIAKDKLE